MHIKCCIFLCKQAVKKCLIFCKSFCFRFQVFLDILLQKIMHTAFANFSKNFVKPCLVVFLLWRYFVTKICNFMHNFEFLLLSRACKIPIFSKSRDWDYPDFKFPIPGLVFRDWRVLKIYYFEIRFWTWKIGKQIQKF